MFRYLVAVAMVTAGMGCQADTIGADNARNIVGNWENAADGDRTYEFRADGGYKSTSRRFGFVVEGTFKIQGNELTIKFDDRTQDVTITKMTDQELVFELHDEKRTENRLKRVK